MDKDGFCKNPHLSELDTDTLYHIGYNTKDHDMKELFSDVKFVVMGGSTKRMEAFAEMIAKEIGHHTAKNMTKTDRFCFYKIGPVISVNHGMGVPSITILLHEILKLLHYSGAKDPMIIRMGTCGGLGVPSGTVVVSNKTLNTHLREEQETIILGRTVARPAVLDQKIAQSIIDAQKDKTVNTILGATLCTDDFYEGQARLDGAFCDFTPQDREDYIQHLKKEGVVNVEMEATAISSLCHKAGVKCAIVCVTLVDRCAGTDQVDLTPDTYQTYQKRPQELVAAFIKSTLSMEEQNGLV